MSYSAASQRVMAVLQERLAASGQLAPRRPSAPHEPGAPPPTSLWARNTATVPGCVQLLVTLVGSAGRLLGQVAQQAGMGWPAGRQEGGRGVSEPQQGLPDGGRVGPVGASGVGADQVGQLLEGVAAALDPTAHVCSSHSQELAALSSHVLQAMEAAGSADLRAAAALRSLPRGHNAPFCCWLTPLQPLLLVGGLGPHQTSPNLERISASAMPSAAADPPELPAATSTTDPHHPSEAELVQLDMSLLAYCPLMRAGTTCSMNCNCLCMYLRVCVCVRACVCAVCARACT